MAVCAKVTTNIDRNFVQNWRWPILIAINDRWKRAKEEFYVLNWNYPWWFDTNVKLCDRTQLKLDCCSCIDPFDLPLCIVFALFVALELCYYTTSISRFFFILACILYIFPCFWHKKDNENGANSWFFLFYPNSLTQRKKTKLYFCRTKENRQQKKSYMVYILRWKATQLRLWPEALQNFLQTEFSILCKDWHSGVSSSDAGTRSQTLIHIKGKLIDVTICA